MAQEQPPNSSSAKTVYSLLNIALNESSPVLVVGYGNPMKATVKAAAKTGITNLWVTGTEDKRRGFSCSGAAKVECLAPKFDARLFSNDYAIIKAIKDTEAKNVLWSLSTPPSESLLQEAQRLGVDVLVPLEADKSLLSWVLVTSSCPVDKTEEIQWIKCPHCKLYHDRKEVLSTGGICPTCHELYRLDSADRINLHFDNGSFVEWDEVLVEPDPLNFPDYDKTIQKQQEKSGLFEAVRTGRAQVKGYDIAVCIMESSFMMGSMGAVVGEKITRAVERATQKKLPLIIFTASGGARMQEGLVSLMQMAKISAAIQAHGREGLLYISVITDPTTGGVSASFATQGDIILAEPHALLGFAGRRVIQDTIKQTLPKDFQTAEFALEHGLIDAIVERKDLRNVLANLVSLHVDPLLDSEISTTESNFGSTQGETDKQNVKDTIIDEKPAPLRPDQFADEVMKGIFEWSEALSENVARMWQKRLAKRQGVADIPSVMPVEATSPDGSNHAWNSVLLARNTHRPTAQKYIHAIFDDFFELHGDRAFGDDKAIIGGIGRIDGRAVTIIGEEKGKDLSDRIERNFGCPQPEGYRKSLRLMHQAEKFGRPIVCLVDTQGAFCGKEAEERGIANAIADNLLEMSGMDVPIVSVVLGEGGSGGALALAASNCVAMQEHAVYSVLSPEGFASILWKDGSRAAEAAAAMKVSAHEAYELGIIEEVLPEGIGPAHENPDQAIQAVASFIEVSLDDLCSYSAKELKDQRYTRFRKF